jgi:hypothetical protein
MAILPATLYGLWGGGEFVSWSNGFRGRNTGPPFAHALDGAGGTQELGADLV